MNNKRILKLIKYNKKLQNKLDINLMNYKIYSGCYIIYENNGKGKEYYYHNEKSSVHRFGRYL